MNHVYNKYAYYIYYSILYNNCYNYNNYYKYNINKKIEKVSFCKVLYKGILLYNNNNKSNNKNNNGI